MTRCGAQGPHLFFQDHQTGAIIAAKGGNKPTVMLKLWICEDKKDAHKNPRVITTPPTEENKKESIVCTAISPIGESRLFGAVIVLEDRGAFLFKIGSDELVPVGHRGGSACESTIGVDNAFFVTAKDDSVFIDFCLSNSNDPLILPVQYLTGKTSVENRIWQVSIKGGNVCAVSTNAIHVCFSDDARKRRWITIPMSSIVSSSIFSDDLRKDSCKIAVLTAIGDVIIIENHQKKLSVSRLTKNSIITPFVSSHTRDCIMAWSSCGQKLYLCKPGGALHTVAGKAEASPHIAAATIQAAWRTRKGKSGSPVSN
tara:strand:- start:177 stop:1115 length:939 start_codon:yes stop_codon:yes gene_type:complete